MQKALNVLYPPQCVTCNAAVDAVGDGLCAQCWGDTPFIRGLACDCCGVPLPGEEATDLRCNCDSCMKTPRLWGRGRAVALYGGNIRKMVLALKHGDRTELAETAGHWMAHASGDILTDKTLIAPVPLHWSRLFKRRYNQAALMAAAFAKQTGNPLCQDLLIRRHRTASLDGKTLQERHETLAGNIFVHPRRKIRMAGRPIVLVDDVMTSGATLTACTNACLSAGASRVDVVVLARVAKDTYIPIS